MIHLFKTGMITAFILGVTWSAPLRAQDQRYISIRNTDTIWLPGNICAYQFRLDNGGNDEGFGPLTMNRPGFPGECFICELRLPDHRFRWKHNKLFLLLPEEYGPAFPAIVDCYTSPPT